MNTKTLTVGIAIGIVIAALTGSIIVMFMPDSWMLTSFSSSHHDGAHREISSNNKNDSSEQPLYWVAPMDPNFKREQPGKSPMGMDLVPVYKSITASAGTVEINPSVVNNLGVKTSTAKLMQLENEVETVGFLDYNQDTLVHIHPRIEGWIETLYIKATGDYVKKGQPLYSLYSPELVNAQEEYVLALQRNNPNLINASESRLQALQVPSAVIERLKSTRKVQQSVVFYAPQTGFVDNLNVREGFYVQPGTTVMAIGALDEIWVEAEVFARQASMLHLDMSVNMTLAYFAGKTWQGKIDYIYPSIDAKMRTVKARIRFDNPNYLLKPGMFANLSLKGNAMPESLVVPTQAVIRTGQQNRVVMALQEGQYKSIEVVLGLVQREYTQILSGLDKGDIVVTSAQFLIDSQSSISSDFKRMESAILSAQGDQPETVSAQAIIVDVMPDERMLTLDHEALEDWNMPAMTMDFMLADDVDMADLHPDMNIHIEIGKTPTGMFEVRTIHTAQHNSGDM